MFSLKHLQDFCVQNKLPFSGTKPKLIQRIRKHFGVIVDVQQFTLPTSERGLAFMTVRDSNTLDRVSRMTNCTMSVLDDGSINIKSVNNEGNIDLARSELVQAMRHVTKTFVIHDSCSLPNSLLSLFSNATKSVMVLNSADNTV